MESAQFNLDVHIPFDHPGTMEKAMDWAVEEIFQKIWMSKLWSKPAKGGKNIQHKGFEKHKDMAYQAHIFSGTAMALKVLDYSYSSIKGAISDEELLFKLKRSIFGYLYHDFNKICGSDFRMEDRSILDSFIKETFSTLSDELGLSFENIYQIVICTEKGTIANILDNNLNITPLNFEMNFSRMADVLSGSFNDKTLERNADILFGTKVLIRGSDVREMKFSSTNLVSITGLVKKSFISIIRCKLNGTYLWSDYNTVYYVGDSLEQKDISPNDLAKELLKEFKVNLSTAMRPEKLINLNDRRVDNSASGFLEQTSESIEEFVKDNDRLKKCIHLEDIKIDTDEKKEAAEKYSDLFGANNCYSFELNYRKTLKKEKGYSLRDGLEIEEFSDNQIDERKRIFVLRYVQLTTDLKSESANKAREIMETVLKTNSSVISPLVGKEPGKSVLVFPFVLKDTHVDWDKLFSEVISHLNRNKRSMDYGPIISKVMPYLGFDNPLPSVPDKFNMSLANGYPAKEEAKGDKLYGLNTNGFNNRLPTSKIGFGRIDSTSMLEYNIRRNLIHGTSGEETLIYLRFPGAIPHLDLSNLLRKLTNKKSKEVIEISKLTLSLDEFSSHPTNVRIDDSFFLKDMIIKQEKDILRELYNVLAISEATKMSVKVSYSNAPVFENQLEAISFDISSTTLSFFSWNKIRLNEIEKVKRTIQTFSVLANGSLEKINFEDTSNIMSAYQKDPMSIFYYAHKRIFENEGGKKSRGFGGQFSQRIGDIRKLGYEVEKRGEQKMKTIEELARIASRITYANWDMSGSERTWILRDPIEALEVYRAKVKGGEKRDLNEFWDIIGGTLNAKLRRDKNGDKSKWIPFEEIKNFSDALIRLLKEDFDGKIPSGATKSYLINAFEFEYMLTTKQGGKKNE